MKKLLKDIALPLIIGIIISLIINPFMNYQDLYKPKLAPPGIIFPIVWTVLYILIGISFYLQKNNNKYIYYTNLIINNLWPIIFFVFKLYLLSFIWIILLIIIVIIMINNFYKINKISTYLNIPYLIWLIFACYLSFEIYLLN